jgi:hypothetical protein
MAKLKLGSIPDDKSVKLTIELPAAVHHDLLRTPRRLRGRQGKRSQTQQNSLYQCWLGSWPRTVLLQN